MLTFFKKIFIWWNQDTFGTRFKTIFFGKFVGKDSFGNKYYESKNGKRWVVYANEIDAFIASISDKRPSVPTGQDGLNALLIADAALQSSQSGQAITIFS